MIGKIIGIHWPKNYLYHQKHFDKKSCRLDFSDGFLWRISEASDSEIFRRKLDQCEWASCWRMQPAVGVLKSQHSQTAPSLSWRTGEKGPVWSGSHTRSHLQSWRVPVAAVLHIWRLHSRNLLFYSKLHCTHSHDNRRLKNKRPVAAEEQWTDWRGKAHSWTERDWERKWLDRHSDSGKFLGKPSIVMKTGFYNLTLFYKMPDWECSAPLFSIFTHLLVMQH